MSRFLSFSEKFLASADSPPRFSRIANNLFYIPPDYLPEEANGNRKLPEKMKRKTFADEVYEARVKTLEFCTFPGVVIVIQFVSLLLLMLLLLMLLLLMLLLLLL